tara:strand:+ start:383 stop:574 length:192 start_codon:yes stop_codon:yes gene_type:complete
VDYERGKAMTQSERIKYLIEQNKFLKLKLEQLTDKYNDLEHQYNKVYEENGNLRLVKGAGEIS